MNRLQKKCIIATAGLHLLLLVILFLGPAFFNSQPKPDNAPVLDMVPANLIDAALNSGVKNATPPPPQPVAVPQPTPPQPQQQQQQVQPAPKVVQPTPTLMQRVEHIFTPVPKPEPVNPTPDAVQPQPHKIVVSTTLVTGPIKSTTKPAKPDHSQDQARALNSALRNLKNNLSPATKVDLSGTSSVAYANYSSVVKSVYDSAWILPASINADENIKVSVTIARDGSVISSHIVTPSGDGSADDSVQRTLDRVQIVAPFPDSWTDSQRTFVILFNPQVKNSE
ncbi:MAG TPA: TonB family protein [Verrucomicrobiae bacterium]|jgi:protein TonB